MKSRLVEKIFCFKMIENFEKVEKKMVNVLEKDKIVEIKNLLIQQIFSKVRWRESINFMISKGVNRFIEIGPGKVLSGLIKRIESRFQEILEKDSQLILSGVGVGAPNVNHFTGRIQEAPNLSWGNVYIVNLFKDRFPKFY